MILRWCGLELNLWRRYPLDVMYPDGRDIEAIQEELNRKINIDVKEKE